MIDRTNEQHDVIRRLKAGWLIFPRRAAWEKFPVWARLPRSLNQEISNFLFSRDAMNA